MFYWIRLWLRNHMVAPGQGEGDGSCKENYVVNHCFAAHEWYGL